jgi:hypothetical protein
MIFGNVHTYKIKAASDFHAMIVHFYALNSLLFIHIIPISLFFQQGRVYVLVCVSFTMEWILVFLLPNDTESPLILVAPTLGLQKQVLELWAIKIRRPGL